MENQLQIIVNESGIDSTKAKYILDNFQNYFEVASEWEIKAKTIKVINENQIDDMKMARTGRLILREKRIAIEKARKSLKEQALREGKAIDGIANVLKALIVPIEEYLDKQERFVEIREEQKQEQLRLDVEKRIEEERITKEKADAEEKEKLRIENKKLQNKAIEHEKKMREIKEKTEKELQKQKNDAKKKQEEIETKAKTEQKKIKMEANAKLKEAEDKLKKVKCPFCLKTFSLKEEV